MQASRRTCSKQDMQFSHHYQKWWSIKETQMSAQAVFLPFSFFFLKTLHTLLGMGSAALAVAVRYPGKVTQVRWPKFPTKDKEAIKEIKKKMMVCQNDTNVSSNSIYCLPFRQLHADFRAQTLPWRTDYHCCNWPWCGKVLLPCCCSWKSSERLQPHLGLGWGGWWEDTLSEARPLHFICLV